jgi:hypothetical protein
VYKSFSAYPVLVYVNGVTANSSFTQDNLQSELIVYPADA